MNQLGYIEQILKESLRLWPTAPVFALSPYKDETIGGQYRMRKNYQIVVLSPMLHRDPKVWGERAEASTPTTSAARPSARCPANAYKPFGNGQRACIGRQFAMQEAALVLGMILQRFKLIDHTRYRLKLKETLTVKPDQFRIKVRRRTDRDRAPAAATTVARRPRRSAAPAARRHGRRTRRRCSSCTARISARPRSSRAASRKTGERAGFAVEVARSTSTRAACPRRALSLIATGVVQRHAPRQCRTLLRLAARRRPGAGRACRRPLRRVRLRQSRLGVDLPGGAAR